MYHTLAIICCDVSYTKKSFALLVLYDDRTQFPKLKFDTVDFGLDFTMRLNIITKVAQIFVDFGGYCKNMT